MWYDSVVMWGRTERAALILTLAALLVAGAGCGARTVRTMEVTGYCGCGDCCGWERGRC